MPRKKEPTFEEALARLQDIVTKMEQGDLPLQELITQYSEGMKLAAACSQSLDRLVEHFHQAAKARVGEKRQAYEKAAESLELLSPIHVLRRGYAVVERADQAVPRVKLLARGDMVALRFADGTAEAEVRATSRTADADETK